MLQQVVFGGEVWESIFNVRVFNPYGLSNRTFPTATCYWRHEHEKRRKYEEKVQEVECDSFVYPWSCHAQVKVAHALPTYSRDLQPCKRRSITPHTALWWRHSTCSTVMAPLHIQHCDGATPHTALWWHHSTYSTVMAPLHIQHCDGTTPHTVLWWHFFDVASVSRSPRLLRSSITCLRSEVFLSSPRLNWPRCCRPCNVQGACGAWVINPLLIDYVFFTTFDAVLLTTIMLLFPMLFTMLMPS